MSILELILMRANAGRGHNGTVRNRGVNRSRCQFCLTLFLFFCPLVQQLAQILLLLTHTFRYLDDYPASFEFHLFALVKLPIAGPVHVADKVSAVVVDHNASVEGMVFESTILPSLLFPSQIVRKEAHKL